MAISSTVQTLLQILPIQLLGAGRSVAIAGYLNTCNIGSHRVQGMCAEIACIAWARQYTYTRGAIFGVYGIRMTSSGHTVEGALSPCGRRDRCQAHLDDPSVRAICVSFHINGKRDERNVKAKPEGEEEFKECRVPEKLNLTTLPKTQSVPKEKAPTEHPVTNDTGKGGKARAPRRHLEAAL